LERKHTACTQKITRNCHTGNTSAKYTTTNALRNYKKNQRNGRKPTRGNYKKPKTKALLFLTQTTEMMISEKQISTRPPSTKSTMQHIKHTQEKKHARRRETPEKN
jgi:3-hydroxyacyl-CoA dehydrogenase